MINVLEECRMDNEEIIAFAIMIILAITIWLISTNKKGDEVWRWIFCVMLGGLFGIFPAALISMVLDKELNKIIWMICAIGITGYLLNNTTIESEGMFDTRGR